jgi:hypothetical protein
VWESEREREVREYIMRKEEREIERERQRSEGIYNGEKRVREREENGIERR